MFIIQRIVFLVCDLVTMADFDAIYPDTEDLEEHIEETHVTLVPDPIVVRGAGNMTV